MFYPFFQALSAGYPMYLVGIYATVALLSGLYYFQNRNEKLFLALGLVALVALNNVVKSDIFRPLRGDNAVLLKIDLAWTGALSCLRYVTTTYFIGLLIKNSRVHKNALKIIGALAAFVVFLYGFSAIFPELRKPMGQIGRITTIFSYAYFIAYGWIGYKNNPSNRNTKTFLLLIGFSLSALNMWYAVARRIMSLGFSSLPIGTVDLFLVAFTGIVLVQELVFIMKSLSDQVKAKTVAALHARSILIKQLNVLIHKVKAPLYEIANRLAYFKPEDVSLSKEEYANTVDRLRQVSRDLEHSVNIKTLKAGLSMFNHNQVTDLKKIVDSKSQSYKTEISKKNRLDFSYKLKGDGPFTARIDPQAAEIVLDCLWHNAVKFTEKGDIVVELEDAGGKIKLKVTDTGCGIAKDCLDKIFDMGYSTGTPAEDSGLGLTMVKVIAQDSRGKIKAKSGDNGSEFIFVLKKSRLRPDTIDMKVTDRTAISGEPAVRLSLPIALVVDDNPEILNQVRASLYGEYRIQTAESVPQALEMLGLADKGERSLEPDVVVSDIVFAGGSNGYEFYDRVSASDMKGVCWLFMSQAEMEKPEYLDKEFTDYLGKPFNTDELLLRVNRLRSEKMGALPQISEELPVSNEDLDKWTFETQKNWGPGKVVLIKGRWHPVIKRGLAQRLLDRQGVAMKEVIAPSLSAAQDKLVFEELSREAAKQNGAMLMMSLGVLPKQLQASLAKSVQKTGVRVMAGAWDAEYQKLAPELKKLCAVIIDPRA